MFLRLSELYVKTFYSVQWIYCFSDPIVPILVYEALYTYETYNRANDMQRNGRSLTLEVATYLVGIIMQIFLLQPYVNLTTFSFYNLK